MLVVAAAAAAGAEVVAGRISGRRLAEVLFAPVAWLGRTYNAGFRYISHSSQMTQICKTGKSLSWNELPRHYYYYYYSSSCYYYHYYYYYCYYYYYDDDYYYCYYYCHYCCYSCFDTKLRTLNLSSRFLCLKLSALACDSLRAAKVANSSSGCRG